MRSVPYAHGLKRGLRDFGLVCVGAYQERAKESVMAISYADADDYGLLPAGVYQLKVEVVSGGRGPDGTLTLAKNGCTMHVQLVYTVNAGDYRNRKIWDYLTVTLDEHAVVLDEHGNPLPPLEAAKKLDKLRTAVRMGRSKIKALINSARGLNPDDKSAATEARRSIESHDDLNGMIFWADVGVRAGSGGYGPSNFVDYIVQPGDPDYPKAAAQEAPSMAVVLAPPRTAAEEMSDEIPF